MNREILFRGERIDNGEWLYGDLCHTQKGLCILTKEINEKENAL